MPVNLLTAWEDEMPLGGNWPGSNRKNPVFTPSIAGKFKSSRSPAVSDRTYAPVREHPGRHEAARNSMDYAEALIDDGST